MSVIKVAFDATAVPIALTGAGYYVVEIVKQLDASNEVELVVITRKSDRERFVKLAPRSKIINVAPNSLPQRLWFQNFKLGQIVDDLGVDIFHGPHYQLPKKMKTPSVVTIHDTTLLTHKEVHKKTKTIYFSKIIPKSIEQAKCIITVSNSTRDDIVSLFHPSKKIVVAQLGYNKERFNTVGPDDIEILKKRGIEGRYVAYLGLIEPRKRIPDLVQAFSQINEKFPDLKLIIGGNEGWGLDELRESIKESGCSTKIILPGRLSDEEVSAFYRQAQCFVYPSVYEGFGMPVLEAMACGAPVITTEGSSLSEVGGDAAVLIEPNSPSQIAQSMEKILSDEKYKNELSKASIKQAENFSWENCSKEHILAYQETWSSKSDARD